MAASLSDESRELGSPRRTVPILVGRELLREVDRLAREDLAPSFNTSDRLRSAPLTGEVSVKDQQFYEGKVAAAQFARTVLAKVTAGRARRRCHRPAAVDIAEASF